jgi:cell wall-associated NlpC family hydrolase
MIPRSRLRLVCRALSPSALASVLVLTACADQLPTHTGNPGIEHSVATSTGVTVVTTAMPDPAAPGDTVAIRMTVTNHTSKRVSVDVRHSVTDPSGGAVRSRTWQKQNIMAGRSLVLEDRFTLVQEAPSGVYSVAAHMVSSDQLTLYVDEAAAAAFTVLRRNSFQYTRTTDPARTVVSDAAGNWLATFTNGARTVTLSGPSRTFAEPEHTTAVVTHSTWVRVLAEPFTGVVDETWLASALAHTTPDILEFSMQYIHGTSPLHDASGFQIAGDADYGPLQEDGTRKEGADHNDYLGIPWLCRDGTVRQPRAEFFRSLDCTGYVQMVFGYRGGLPLSCRPDGIGIPRTARDALASAPGIIVTPNNGTQVTDFSRLQVGDLVFFDASEKNGTEIDHVGIYLGWDGRFHRFISSRKGANGPTMGDTGGRSSLSGGNTYATGFRAVRRL